ncbi:synaptic vesicle transporter [Saccharata proteae CBS 121410]|uniref:Synaptic vesicle transporter n=1 Tax=Saccharata proteae CBS 121410 TaxID=1314787 RepID=A0A6A5YBE9_9PEZI|nr:synaptic vesicle transporter [Saccharata proteae CBS 121410]
MESATSTPDSKSIFEGNNASPDPENAISKFASNTAHNYSYPLWRKCLIVFVTSWMTLASTFSSTSLFTASSEIAADFSTTATKVNLSIAGVILAMGFSTFIWGPIGRIVGRKIAYNACIVALLAFSIGAAVAPNFRTFVVMRVISGLQGTYFHVSGQVILASCFPPTQRGTATGFFLAGTTLGPPLGPLFAGIIVTFTSWRIIIWTQAAMIGFGFVMSILFIPWNKVDEKRDHPPSVREALAFFSPSPILKQMLLPNVLFTDLACGLLSWTQYQLLSAPRKILTNRFHLTSPLIAGLFYLAPAAGFLAGTMIGGRFSDRTVCRWIDRRNGVRLPQDRLNAGMISFFFVVPAASLVYGWCLEYNKGGLALPIVMAFFTAAGLLSAFASLNTYCAEVLPSERLQVIAGKYCIQYILGACGSGSADPLIEAIGVGPMSTIGATLVLIGGILTLITARYGLRMQDWVERRSTGQSNGEKPR